MQSRFWMFWGAWSLVLGMAIAPSYAQVAPNQVERLVEALRQAAPKPDSNANTGYYSDWQVQANNIPRWSKSCTGQELTPAQFAANASTARRILACVMGDVLKDEYRASGNNEAIAVRRAASWWMTGDPNRYDSESTKDYTQQVLSFYQSLRPVTVPTVSTGSAATSSAVTTSGANTLADYDRYMKAGYQASQKRDYAKATLYFRRALDERPEDTYAQQALRNVETYRDRPRP